MVIPGQEREMSKKKKQKGRAGENENVEDKITIGGRDYEVDREL